MKLKLLGGAALAIALAVSSGAWANPKNSFSPGGVNVVISVAAATAIGGGNDVQVGGVLNFAGNQDCAGSGGGNCNAAAAALSEVGNVSVEAVEVSTLVGVSTLNIQAATAVAAASQATVAATSAGRDAEVGNENEATAFIINGGASASSSRTSGLTQSAAASGNGSFNVQGQSVAAAGNINF